MASILLVDDSEENRAALEALLADEGHVVETVRQGGLALSRGREIEPDLILIDLLLPGVPSWHIIRDLHRDPALIGVPILGLSPEGMGGARERALAAGCVAFIGVPIAREAARGTIAHHLRERQQSDVTQTRPLAFGTPSIRTRPRARVLLASADADFLHLYGATLRYRRYQVDAVSSIAEVIERVDASPPHLLVLDRTLADGSGVEASRRVKARPRDPFVPVLLLVDPDAVESAISGSGADDFLAVPFTETELRHRVRSLLFLASAVEGERDRSRQLAAVARQMSIGLVLVDADGRIVLMNEPSARILGVTAGELRGRSVRHLFRTAGLLREDGEPLPPDFDPFRRFRSAGRPTVREIYALAAGGETAPIEIGWTAVLDAARKFRGAAVSTRRLSRDGESQRALADAYDRLMEVDQLKSKFLSTVSHELRTPLNTIILLSHVLTSEAPDARPMPARERDLQIIRQSANALLHMINNLLDLARIEGGQAEVSPEPVEIRRFLAETVEIIAPQAERKKLPLRLAIGEDVPERLELDRDKTRQVLLNLMSNAVKFTDRGEVALEVGRVAGGTTLAFSVRDTGTGIPADKLAMVFEPFRQVAQGEAASAGSGLGLSIVKELVHLMGGEITVTSRPGEGSAFRATIPCRVASAEPGAPESPRPPSAPAGRRPRILVVEDDRNSRYGLRTVLELEGYEAAEAGSAQEAVAALAGGGFDAVFMDISLPDADGTAVIRRLRSEPATAALPIVALTGRTSDGDRRTIDESGASAYLSKPVDVKGLLKTLSALLDRVEQPAPGPASR